MCEHVRLSKVTCLCMYYSLKSVPLLSLSLSNNICLFPSFICIYRGVLLEAFINIHLHKLCYDCAFLQAVLLAVNTPIAQSL
jgi:hypothetical protein